MSEFVINKTVTWGDSQDQLLDEFACINCGHIYHKHGLRETFCDNCDEVLEVKKIGFDMVNEPPHYKDASGVGCTEVVKHMMYFGGACFKYLYRCGNKWDDIGDLKKAVRCAQLADDDRFINDESWLRAMYQVASHREGNIRDAMLNIRSQQWSDVIDCILAEIVRLESEDKK